MGSWKWEGQKRRQQRLYCPWSMRFMSAWGGNNRPPWWAFQEFILTHCFAGYIYWFLKGLRVSPARCFQHWPDTKESWHSETAKPGKLMCELAVAQGWVLGKHRPPTEAQRIGAKEAADTRLLQQLEVKAVLLGRRLEVQAPSLFSSEIKYSLPPRDSLLHACRLPLFSLSSYSNMDRLSRKSILISSLSKCHCFLCSVFSRLQELLTVHEEDRGDSAWKKKISMVIPAS